MEAKTQPMSFSHTTSTVSLSILLIAISLSQIASAVESNEIYSVNTIAGESNITLALTVDPTTKTIGLAEFNSGNGRQRFIARANTDHTFTLFSEMQPWNWVEHIVESSKYVHINQIPQVLGVIGGTKEVIEENYEGTGSSRQKWYVVPTGEDADTGVVTNVLLRQCLVGQGENQPLTIAACNFSDANQVFSLTQRSSERC